MEDNFNPRTPCGVRPRPIWIGCWPKHISIHAPLAGCDIQMCLRETDSRISIHAPLAGCDTSAPGAPGHATHFNPRTPCGVRRPKRCAKGNPQQFQSTHPLRGATSPLFSSSVIFCISIHAPLAGCDVFALLAVQIYTHFNPRTPCGVRPLVHHVGSDLDLFQSTHPLRGATILVAIGIHGRHISIHAPLAGCDPWGGLPGRIPGEDFNPRTPCGVRRSRRQR